MQGKYIQLEPLEQRHIDGLVTAATGDPSLYQWSPVPRGREEAAEYVETALAWRDAGSAVPFAIVRADDGVVIGSTRFFNLERWVWPAGHPSHGRLVPDACEIGYTWLAHSAVRTPANTEAKLLMLTYGFETWEVLRVCLHTDVRNLRSRAAIERIGGPVRRDSPRAPDGRGLHPSRLGALFDRRGGVAGSEAKAASAHGTSLARTRLRQKSWAQSHSRSPIDRGSAAWRATESRDRTHRDR